MRDVDQLKELVALDGRRVLDVGCGHGDVTLGTARLGADATGLEISEQLLAPARAADTRHEASWVVGVAEELPFADATFDVVLFMKSLHHVAIAAMAPALAQARRVLRDGGTVYVEEPLLDGSYYALIKLVEDEDEVRTAAQQVIAGAASAGLRIVTVAGYDLVLAFDSFAALTAQVAGVDPHRAPAIAAHREQLQAIYERVAEVDPQTGVHVFRQPMRVHVLQVAD